MKHPLWTADEVKKATHGTLVGSLWDAWDVKTDHRHIRPGDFFIALQGPNVDAHKFVEDAFEAGAHAAMVEYVPKNLKPHFPIVLVSDTFKALQDLARASRQRARGKVVAVTGSYGKTSTKELLRLVLSEQGETFAVERSHNNIWGVSEGLVRFPAGHDYGVFEIGMNHRGEIEPLANLISPHVAIITNVGEMHIENLGSYENIALEKASIFKGLLPGGTAVINRDDALFDLVMEEARKASVARVVTFGTHEESDLRLLSLTQDNNHISMHVSVFGAPLNYQMGVMGSQWGHNSLAVLGGVLALEGDITKASASLKNFKSVEGRGEQHQVTLPDGGQLKIIDESYNAGPLSMRHAIEVLGAEKTPENGRRIAVLGDMLELGEYAEEAHRGLSAALEAYNIDLVFTFGEHMMHLHQALSATSRAAHEVDIESLAQAVKQTVHAGDVVLIKGSKGARAFRGRMYRVIEALKELEA